MCRFCGENYCPKTIVIIQCVYGWDKIPKRYTCVCVHVVGRNCPNCPITIIIYLTYLNIYIISMGQKRDKNGTQKLCC